MKQDYSVENHDLIQVASVYPDMLRLHIQAGGTIRKGNEMTRCLAILAGTALLLFSACTDNPFDPDGWNTLNHDGFTLKWRVSGSNLEVELTGPGTGWVAVGFAGSYLMHDSNIIIGAVSGSSVNVRDDFGIDSNTHVSDTSLQGGEQNVSSISGEQDSGSTTISFTTPLDSGDLYDNALAEGSTYNVLFAAGPDDNLDSGYSIISSTSLEL